MADDSVTFDSNPNSTSNSPLSGKKPKNNYDQIRSNLKCYKFSRKAPKRCFINF